MKIVFLVSRVPYPLEKGDKLRAFHQLKGLAADHEIHLIALNDRPLHKDAISELRKYCKSVCIYPIEPLTVAVNLIRNIFSKRPFQVAWFTHEPHKLAINKKIEEISPDLIYYQLIRTCEYARNLNYPKVLDFMDILSLGIQQRGNQAGILKPLYRLESKRTKAYESLMHQMFRFKTIISEQDRSLFSEKEQLGVTVIPNGVDTSFFKPIETTKVYDVLFTGNMNYPPNIDGAVFLAKEIMPLVWGEVPSAKVLIAGANPHDKVKELASERVSVSGWVEDIRQCYASSKIFVAPMRIGTGMQNKLLEAMAMKLPCITSKLANGAILADETAVKIATSTEEYAKQIVFWLKNPEEAEACASSGNNFVRTHYSWKEVTMKLNDLFLSVLK